MSTDGKQYVTLQSIGYGENFNPESHNKYSSYINVTEQLFKEENGKYQYQYDKATPDLSLVVGINKYVQCLKNNPEDVAGAAKKYNANPNEKEEYAKTIVGIVNEAKAAEQNGKKGNITILD